MSQSETSKIFDRIEMSHNLRGSLQRAITYAFEQSHREVTLEHLLLALADDREAGVILEASAVNVQALLTDVSGYLGRLEDRITDGGQHQPGLGSDVRHIIQSAGAAAQKSQRRAVTSALVLAAIVGEGRSPSAQILRSHGLTFENAIAALKQANAAASARPVAQQPIDPAAVANHAPQPADPVRPDPPPSAGPTSTLAATAQPPPAGSGSAARLQNMQAAHEIIAGARERIAAARGAIAAKVGEAEAAAPGEPQPDPVLRYADGEPIPEVATLAVDEEAQAQDNAPAPTLRSPQAEPAPAPKPPADPTPAAPAPARPDVGHPGNGIATAPAAPPAPAADRGPGDLAVPAEAPAPPVESAGATPHDARVEAAPAIAPEGAPPAPASDSGEAGAAPSDPAPPQLAPPPPPVFEPVNRSPGAPSSSPAAAQRPGDPPFAPAPPATPAERPAQAHPAPLPLPTLTVPPPHVQAPPPQAPPSAQMTPPQSSPAQTPPAAQAPSPPIASTPAPSPSPLPAPPRAQPSAPAQAAPPGAPPAPDQPPWHQSPPPGATPSPPPGPLTMPGRQPPQQDGAAARQPISSPQPAPPATARPPVGAPAPAQPQFEPMPRAMAPPTFAPSPGMPPQQMAFDAEPLEPEDLIRDIPDRMRIGVPTTVEIRALRAQLEAWSGGNSDPRARDDQIITKAMVMRLKAPEGGFTVETASPETQWSEGYMGPLSDEIVSWRWIVTPLESGRMPLQLSVSTRVVARDGLAAARVLPEQHVAVRVSPNYARWGRRAAIGLAFAMAGLLIGYFADGLFSVGSTILVRQ